MKTGHAAPKTGQLQQATGGKGKDWANPPKDRAHRRKEQTNRAEGGAPNTETNLKARRIDAKTKHMAPRTGQLHQASADEKKDCANPRNKRH